MIFYYIIKIMKNMKKQIIKKKSDDTKIKYIINKINLVSDYYNNENEIKKLFHIPLKDRNGILINTYEDVKIISKMKNIISMDNEKVDLFNDLINYKLYPYISFKDFKNGIFFNSNKTLSAFRNISFDSIKKFNIMQDRIISNNMHVNIVGLAIINDNSQINCLSTNSFINICDNNKDPLVGIKTLINEKLQNDKSKNFKNNYFWMFDLDNQKISIPKYDISNNMSKNDVLKIVLSYLYDYTMESVLGILKNTIKNTHPKMINEYIEDINNVSKIYPDIKNNQYLNKINELEYLIYYIKSNKVEDKYDYKEDDFPGLFGKIYKLPVIKKNKVNRISNIYLHPDFKIKQILQENDDLIDKQINKDLELDIYVEDDNNEFLSSICQHTITWDKIGELKKE